MIWLTLIVELQDRDPQPFLVDLRRVARVRSWHPPPDIGVMADDDTEADPSRLDEDRIEHEDVRKVHASLIRIVEDHRVAGPQVVVVARQHLRRSEEHTSELQALMRISYAVFCWKKK